MKEPLDDCRSRCRVRDRVRNGSQMLLESLSTVQFPTLVPCLIVLRAGSHALNVEQKRASRTLQRIRISWRIGISLDRLDQMRKGAQQKLAPLPILLQALGTILMAYDIERVLSHRGPNFSGRIRPTVPRPTEIIRTEIGDGFPLLFP